MIFFGSDVLSWEPLIEVWLQGRPGIERMCLKKQFTVFMGPVIELVCDRSGQNVIGLTRTCLAYLTSLMNVR